MNRLIALTLVGAAVLAGCQTDAQVASYNVSKAADQFEINRRIIFYNGITDSYMLTIEGRCSIEDQGNQLEVICRVEDEEYKKHFLGLSDNVSYFVEQLEPADVDVFRYRVIFRPTTIIPDIDTETP